MANAHEALANALLSMGLREHREDAGSWREFRYFASDQATLAECARFADSTKTTFERMLGHDLSPDFSSVLRHHYAELLRLIDEVRFARMQARLDWAIAKR